MANSKNSREQSRIISRLFEEEKWSQARTLLLKWLKEKPNGDWLNHWLLARISTTYYEERAYSKAIKYAEQALKIAPRCPLVLWDYGGALDMLKRNEEAMLIFKGLLRRGSNRIANGQCGEGIRWARSLVNDSRYRLGLLYARKSNFPLAIKYIEEHVTNRGRNCPSIYYLRDVKKELVMLQEGEDPRR